MKKILALSVLLLFCLSLLAAAIPDLIIEDFQLKTDKVLPKESYGYTLKIKNIGDQPAKTRLPITIYLDGTEAPKFPTLLASSYADTRKQTAVNPIKILTAEGKETTQIPVYEEGYSYLAPALTAKEIEEKKQYYLARSGEKNSDVINQELSEIEIYYGQRHNETISGYFLILNPSETALFDTEATFAQAEEVFVPGGEPSLVPFEATYNLEIDPKQEADNNPYNNKLVAKFLIEPNVIQGPQPETPKNKELVDASEYFSYGSVGCIQIQEKNICLNVDNEEKNAVVSVNGQEEKYSFYGMFMTWINKVFGDGKLAPTKDIRGVEVTIYKEGLKLKLTGV